MSVFLEKQNSLRFSVAGRETRKSSVLAPTEPTKSLIIYGWISGFIYIASYIGLSEMISYTLDDYNKPLFIQMLCGVCYAGQFFVWYAMKSDLDWKTILIPTMIGGSLICAIGCSYTASLAYTAPAVNNTLGSSDCVWVYFLSLAFLGVEFEYIKMVGILVCLSGVALISFGSSSDDDNDTTIGGIIIILISTMLYSCFAVYLKIVSDNYFVDDLKDCYLFMGMGGVFHSIIMVPLVLVANATDLEEFENPDGPTWGWIIGIVLDKTINYVSSIIMVGILSPVFLTLCNLSVSPLSFFISIMFLKGDFGALQLLGSAVVCFGVLIFKLGHKIMNKICPPKDEFEFENEASGGHYMQMSPFEAEHEINQL